MQPTTFRFTQLSVRLLVIFFMFSILIPSCKKTDKLSSIKTGDAAVTGRFFTLPDTLNTAVKRVAAELQQQNNQSGFIAALAKKEGYPVWNKAYIQTVKSRNNSFTATAANGGGGNGDTAVLIPLAVPGENHIGAFIIGTVTDAVSLKLFRQGDYAAFPLQSTNTTSGITTAEDFALKMMIMDNQVFGIKEFEIKDKRLFNPTADYKDTAGKKLIVKFGDSAIAGGNGYTTNNILQTLCVTVYTTTRTVLGNHCRYPAGHCPDYYTGIEGPCDNCAQVCANVSVSTTSSVQCVSWFEHEEGEWPVFAPGGGGGGGVGTNPPPCPLSSYLINNAVPVGCNPNPGPNPWPVPDPPPTQEQLDVYWMNQHIKDSTNDPCVTNAVVTLKAISSKFPVLIRNFFSESPNFKMILRTHTNSNWNSNINPPVPPEGAKTTPSADSSYFNVSINKYYKDCTDLGLATTIIHEALHCQLLNWYRLAYFSPDSTNMRITLASQYGFLFPPPTIDVSTDSLLSFIIVNQNPSQHEAMINRYLDDVANALYQFAVAKNINIDINYCKDLAWSGCFDSQAYQNLPASDKNRIKKRCSAEKDPYSNLFFTDANGLDHFVNGDNYKEKGNPCQ